MPIYELHAHTAECDKAAHVGGADMVRMYRDAGYDGIVITDHYFSLFFEWFADELAGADHRAEVERWQRGYYAARNEGERWGFTVLAGAEVRFDGSINDYLVYGVEPNFFLSAPRLNELGSVEALKAILPSDALVVQAHPFRNGMTVQDPAPLDGIEVYNGGTEPIRNELSERLAAYHGKIMTSGSDFHCPDHLARGGIVTDRPIRTSADLTAILRSGAYTLQRGE